MKQQTTVSHVLSGERILDALVPIMEKHFEDFPDVQQKYRFALDRLENELGEAAVAEAKTAIRQRLASTLLFSGFLGIQANLHYDADPVAGNFLNTDPEIYLRERAAMKLPDYEKAQEQITKFYGLLSDAQKKLYEDVSEYTCYLETVGPKLAHYCGYLLGNELLPRVIPGFCPDMAYTVRYGIQLEEFFGVHFDPALLNNIWQ